MLEIQELKTYIDMDMNQFITRFTALDNIDLVTIKEIITERLGNMKFIDSVDSYIEKLSLINERLKSYNG